MSSAPAVATARPATETQAQSAAEGLLDQFAVALAGEDAQPDGQFLNHVEDRDEHQLQKQQAVAPLHAALAGGDDAADVSVGQHDDETRAQDRREARQAAVANRPSSAMRLSQA